MSSPLKSLARRALEAIPLSIYFKVIRRDVLVFLYHIVGPPGIAHVEHLYPYKRPEMFERDLLYLASRFRMVSYDEIPVRPSRSGRPCAHITFDDGYSECDTVARPILLKLGIPGTFFLTTDLIDNRTMFHRNKASLCIEKFQRKGEREVPLLLRALREPAGRLLGSREAFGRWILSLRAHEEERLDAACDVLQVDVPAYLSRRRPYLTTGQVHSLAADGFVIGAHGRRHVPFCTLAGPAAGEEIVSSCRAIRDLTGRPQVPFAFPHSADGVDRGFLRSLAASQPVVGRLFDTHRLDQDDPLIVNRITVDAPPAGSEATDLPQVLNAAYAQEAAASLRRTAVRLRLARMLC